MLAGSFNFLNTSGETAPPGCVLEPTGVVDGDGRIEVRKPTADNQLGVFVNSLARVSNGEAGVCFAPFPGVVFAAHTGDTLAARDQVGTKSGDWYLRKGQRGFLYVGGDAGRTRFGNAAPEPVTVASNALPNQSAGVSSGFTLTASSFAWEDVTGMSITVAESGLYLVMFSVSGFIATANPGGAITVRLRQTGSANANFAQRYVCRAPVGGTGAGFTQGGASGTGAGQLLMNLNASDVVRVQVMREFSGTVHTSVIPTSGGDGNAAHLTIIKIN